ncbi:MAG: DUF1175 domain-containing protein [Bryobacteraceae bacterium]|nr:DUF1175 domain-containing protein [Bryobacteraceae bacterium]
MPGLFIFALLLWPAQPESPDRRVSGSEKICLARTTVRAHRVSDGASDTEYGGFRGVFADQRRNAPRRSRGGLSRFRFVSQENDSARLTHPADQRAFRLWFTFLAESQYHLPPARRAKDVIDCAALLRFAYRETLRKHDAAWLKTIDLPALPALPPIDAAVNPGTRLFRTGAGTYGQFADARTLRQWNAAFVSRRLADARPGDLLFFEQVGQRMPFHAMIYLGKSEFTRGPEAWIVYHTGPVEGRPGEMRRLSREELLAHPQPRWRPLEANPVFLGLYRWRILSAAP